MSILHVISAKIVNTLETKGHSLIHYNREQCPNVTSC